MATPLFTQTAIMPKDPTAVLQGGRLANAWVHYLGFLEKLSLVSKAATTTPSAQTWETVAGADLAGALVAATVNALVNEIKADVNTNSAASAAVEAKLNTVIAALKTAGLMET